MLADGLSALTEVWTWVTANSTLGGILGIAVALIAIGGVMSLFLRK